MFPSGNKRIKKPWVYTGGLKIAQKIIITTPIQRFFECKERFEYNPLSLLTQRTY